MDVTKIESLARLMQETGLTALELSEGETTLKLERRQEVIAAPAAPAAVPAVTAGAQARRAWAMAPAAPVAGKICRCS